ncbi:MAG: ROK family protein [Clostridia bacterium]|nr:ROK family protein [Clostridia bacterium]
MLYGALEGGGTKMVLAAMDENGSTAERISIPTESPDKTMPVMIDFYRKHGVRALGIGNFGPLDLNEKSETYGSITATPKLLWRGYPLLQAFRDALRVPVKIDTDVNAAALAEARLGAAKGAESCVYVTVGTGIGGGIIIGGKPVHGLMHPEVGHALVSPLAGDPMPDGSCPYHKHCLEGMASGPAIEARWGVSAKELPRDHPAWVYETEYLAQMCVSLTMFCSPEKIILGGGVMQQAFLFDSIRKRTSELLSDYISPLSGSLDDYIVPPGLGIHSGITGAWLLALQACE